MKQRNFFAVLWLACSLSLSAQTQQGYVKTLGRPNQQGRALSDVSIRVKGGHNAVLSGQDGTFAMPMPGKKLGDAYSLQQVHKSGYDLKDKDAVGRQYAYSNKVPLTLVMFSRSDYQQEKQRIENVIYNTVEKRYKAEFARLKQQENTHRITAEQARQQLHQLQDGLEKIQGLVDGLAEHYAQVDYDELNDKEREINLAIEAGELERADSLLQLLGIQQRAQDIAQRLQAGETLKKEAQQETAEVLKRQEKDAEYLYQLYTIALAKFDNDKARFYIETRAALDTMNIEWQIDAAEYVMTYWSDFNKYQYYYQRAFKQSISSLGTSHPMTIKCCQALSSMLMRKDRMDLGMELYKKAEVELSSHLEDEEYAEQLAVQYTICGQILYSKGQYEEIIPYIQRALVLIKQKYGDENEKVAEYYEMLGGSYNWNNRCQEALSCFQKALYIYNKCGASPLKKCNVKSIIGATYAAIDNRNAAIKYMQEAVDTLKIICGTENHNSIAVVYKSMRDCYSEMLEYEKALEYADKAINIKRNLFGEIHSDVASAYEAKANVYLRKGDYQNVPNLFKKALEIKKQLYDPKHIEIGNSCLSLGIFYFQLKDYKEAKSLFLKALDIYEYNSKTDSQGLASTYHNFGYIFTEEGDYESAKKHFFAALEIKRRMWGENHSQTSLTCLGIADMYEKMKDYNKAILYYEKSLKIEISVSGEYGRIVSNIYLNLGNTYAKIGDLNNALKNYEKSYKISVKVNGENHELSRGLLELIHLVREKLAI